MQLTKQTLQLKLIFGFCLQATVELKLTPFILFLHRILDKLQAIDVARVFAEPVQKSEAPDYHDVIKNPMDFSTMYDKIEQHQYR